MTGTLTPPGSQSSLREANTARIIDSVKQYGQITQIELASATGLSAATVSNIVKQLHSQGIIETQNTIRSGRRAQLVIMKRTTGLWAGAHIGRRKMHLILSDIAQNNPIEKIMPLSADHRIDTTLDRIAMLVIEMAKSIGSSIDEVLALGIALPAPINPETKQISIHGIMPGWEDISIADVLSNRLNRPVFIDNDANLAVIGESKYGILRGVENAMFVRVSQMTGAGILINGNILHGKNGIAGEIGHIQINPSGLICQCGARGCLNTVVGADTIVDLLKLNRRSLNLSDVIQLAIDGDPGCQQVIGDAGATIGKVLADLVISLDLSHIVVGGELAATQETLLTPMRKAILGRTLVNNQIKVEASSLKERAEVLGAFSLATIASGIKDTANDWTA